jgi:hypothetical protein
MGRGPKPLAAVRRRRLSCAGRQLRTRAAGPASVRFCPDERTFAATRAKVRFTLADWTLG